MGVVRNEHERVVEAPAEAVGALLDRLSAEDDPVFPVPAWAPMTFDRPLGVGATGGHGPIRYSVTAHERGRRIRFAFTPPGDGFHEVTVEPRGGGRCLVRHVLEMRQSGVDRLLWPTAVRPVHDTMVEELFDNIERAAAGGCARPVRWSPRLRLLNRLWWPRPETVEVPAEARLLRASVERPGYRDAYRMELRAGLPRDPAAWTGVLRDAFPVIAREDGELLMDVDTAGLTARASILVDERHVTLSTAVRADAVRSRLYWGVVKRVHPFMARMMLRRVHRRLALAAPHAADRATGSDRSTVSAPSHFVSG
ncbi:SRPBCC family protein [Streptomyces sp. NPDC029674]|uniref:SRPBCC family protein n=1 Tax=Streptomyces sp. NPDC029674 TaxID=3365297 RepID=UPI00384BAFF0